MPTLVFRLRNVPEDEADDVRALMDENEFDWYETSAGNWGIAMPGIWISKDEELPTCQATGTVSNGILKPKLLRCITYHCHKQ